MHAHLRTRDTNGNRATNSKPCTQREQARTSGHDDQVMAPCDDTCKQSRSEWSTQEKPVCLHVSRHCVELLLQFHPRHAIELGGMNCMAAESCERDQPGRLFDGDREGKPAVGGFGQLTGSLPCGCTRSPMCNQGQDAPPDRPVGPPNGSERGHDAAIPDPCADLFGDPPGNPPVDPPVDPPGNPPGRSRSHCLLGSRHGSCRPITT
jgi:hypothetical protein